MVQKYFFLKKAIKINDWTDFNETHTRVTKRNRTSNSVPRSGAFCLAKCSVIRHFQDAGYMNVTIPVL
jgi:hypothetical protein